MQLADYQAVTRLACDGTFGRKNITAVVEQEPCIQDDRRTIRVSSLPKQSGLNGASLDAVFRQWGRIRLSHVFEDEAYPAYGCIEFQEEAAAAMAITQVTISLQHMVQIDHMLFV